MGRHPGHPETCADAHARLVRQHGVAHPSPPRLPPRRRRRLWQLRGVCRRVGGGDGCGHRHGPGPAQGEPAQPVGAVAVLLQRHLRMELRVRLLVSVDLHGCRRLHGCRGGWRPGASSARRSRVAPGRPGVCGVSQARDPFVRCAQLPRRRAPMPLGRSCMFSRTATCAYCNPCTAGRATPRRWLRARACRTTPATPTGAAPATRARSAARPSGASPAPSPRSTSAPLS